MINEEASSLSGYDVLVTLSSKLFLLTTVSFTFSSDVKDIADVGIIFRAFEVCCWDDDRREDNLVVDGIESCPREDFLDKEGVDTLCDSIMINKQFRCWLLRLAEGSVTNQSLFWGNC